MFDLVCYLDGNLLCHLRTTIRKTSSGCFFLSPYHFRHLRQDAAHRESHNCTDSWTSASCFGDSQASLSSSISLSFFASEKSQQMLLFQRSIFQLVGFPNSVMEIEVEAAIVAMQFLTLLNVQKGTSQRCQNFLRCILQGINNWYVLF